MAASRTDGDPSTREIQRRLFAASNFDLFLEENADGMHTPKLCYHLTELCRSHALKPVEVIRRADLDRTYGHQLFNGTRKPSRDKLIQLAFGLGLTVEETQELLKTAQKSALYPKLLRDAAIMRCLYEGKTIDDAQTLLGRLGLTPIGGGDRDG
ncbi:MAG TPA: helix-turn-helix transcriptional regulator [Candidatus Limiplasma sp.]|nr:helix-turn-helix transcriptional regulator [Candidatus Limiplasma sp.]